MGQQCAPEGFDLGIRAPEFRVQSANDSLETGFVHISLCEHKFLEPNTLLIITSVHHGTHYDVPRVLELNIHLKPLVDRSVEVYVAHRLQRIEEVAHRVGHPDLLLQSRPNNDFV